ncbi:MAG: HAD-IA family hydrolase [Pseudomonadales bacterium]
MKLKAILFDLDGTLLDTAPDFIFCANQLRQQLGKPALSEGAIRAQVSNGARAMTRLVGDLTEGDPAIDALNCQLLAIYQEVLGQNSTLFPGFPASLRWIAEQGLAWGVITNKPSRFTLPLVEQLDVPSAPSTVVCPDHVSRSKPDPEPMLLACQQCGCSPTEAIYFGDHARDIEAGRAAGMLTVACEWGYIAPSENIDHWAADFRLASAHEIPALITQISQQQLATQTV